ncbi:hypothetical protein L9F63_000073, partial [Diploptera punctata]
VTWGEEKSPKISYFTLSSHLRMRLYGQCLFLPVDAWRQCHSLILNKIKVRMPKKL